MGITEVQPGVLSRKRDHDSVDACSSHKVKMTMEEEKGEHTDDDSEILIWIDYCNTPHPKLREVESTFTQAVNALESEKEKSKSDEGSESFRMPTHNVKSRANSEKSVAQKKLLMSKLISDASQSTLQTNSGKIKL